MFHTTIGFEHLSFSAYEEDEDEAFKPPFLTSQAAGGFFVYDPSLSGFWFNGGKDAEIYPMFVWFW
jgi:hypothetical protein